jgi:hypothetical protein
MSNLFDSYMATLPTLSAGAPVPEETAIFYSGMGTNGLSNLQNAGIVQAEAPGKFYIIQNTQVGQFINDVALLQLKVGNLTPDQFEQLWNVASQMFAKAAQGNVCALIGVNDASNTWYDYELPVILAGESGVTSVNDLTVSSLGTLGQAGANAAVFGLT